ncbi:hypothetical protein GCM10009111_27780 [Colwellia asteriadis]|uniref:DUF1330 domain-containing protein n=1 Tax=Colwellia asteriadis TaxID=517723 RepID=A0ABN1L9L6_9GAMM
MAFERIMGLEVIDDKEYQYYREAMEPLLKRFGGAFGYDFKVAEVLRTKTVDNINRVFTITFPSEQVMTDFFANPEYLVIKQKHFHSSVKSTTTIALHETHDE